MWIILFYIEFISVRWIELKSYIGSLQFCYLMNHYIAYLEEKAILLYSFLRFPKTKRRLKTSF